MGDQTPTGRWRPRRCFFASEAGPDEAIFIVKRCRLRSEIRRKRFRRPDGFAARALGDNWGGHPDCEDDRRLSPQRILCGIRISNQIRQGSYLHRDGWNR